MYTIKTLNAISPVGLAKLPANQFEIDNEAAAPQGILVRSADMHDAPLPDSLLAIARAGAGTNNIPVEDCTNKGIVVFNTPGANANAVKELVLGGLVLASRKVGKGMEWAKTLAGQGDAIGKLVEKGIPREEIAFIHEAGTEAKKAELFAKVRAGQVRILLGSTPKLGAGTNIQDRLIALHHLDCPWKPSDVGRILRTFKIKKNVEVTDNGKIII